MGVAPRRILSPLRLPIPPQRPVVTYAGGIIGETSHFVKEISRSGEDRLSLHASKVVGKCIDLFFRDTSAERWHLSAGIVGFRILNLLVDIFPSASASHIGQIGTDGAALAFERVAVHTFLPLEYFCAS